MDVIDESLDANEYEESPEGNGSDKAELDDIFGDDKYMESPRRSKVLKSKATVALPERSTHTENSTILSVRAPNFLKFQKDEFIKDKYDPEEERATFDAAIAIARWRFKRDANGELEKDSNGQPIKESNARLVKWSDGSFQVLVGDQVFSTSVNALDNWYDILQFYLFWWPFLQICLFSSSLINCCYSFTYKHQHVLAEARDGDDGDEEGAGTCLESVTAISHRMKLQNTSQEAEVELRQAIKASGRFNKGSQ